MPRVRVSSPAPPLLVRGDLYPEVVRDPRSLHALRTRPQTPESDALDAWCVFVCGRKAWASHRSGSSGPGRWPTVGVRASDGATRGRRRRPPGGGRPDGRAATTGTFRPAPSRCTTFVPGVMACGAHIVVRPRYNLPPPLFPHGASRLLLVSCEVQVFGRGVGLAFSVQDALALAGEAGSALGGLAIVVQVCRSASFREWLKR